MRGVWMHAEGSSGEQRKSKRAVRCGRLDEAGQGSEACLQRNATQRSDETAARMGRIPRRVCCVSPRLVQQGGADDARHRVGQLLCRHRSCRSCSGPGPFGATRCGGCCGGRGYSERSAVVAFGPCVVSSAERRQTRDGRRGVNRARKGGNPVHTKPKRHAKDSNRDRPRERIEARQARAVRVHCSKSQHWQSASALLKCLVRVCIHSSFRTVVRQVRPEQGRPVRFDPNGGVHRLMNIRIRTRDSPRTQNEVTNSSRCSARAVNSSFRSKTVQISRRFLEEPVVAVVVRCGRPFGGKKGSERTQETRHGRRQNDDGEGKKRTVAAADADLDDVVADRARAHPAHTAGTPTLRLKRGTQVEEFLTCRRQEKGILVAPSAPGTRTARWGTSDWCAPRRSR